MAPAPWASAGSAPYNNVIGLDPELTDPENGDYRPAPGSPAEGYGCQTFGRPLPTAEDDPPAPVTCTGSFRDDVIEVAGSISEDTLWDAETIRVIGDVTVEHGVTLTVAPGVLVEFQDYYSLTVAGTLLAIGTPDCCIRFTTDEPQYFTVDQSHAGCWNGIWFDETLATNAPSCLAYCIIEYSKATGDGDGLYLYGGGALSAVDFSQLTIENCIIRNNVADYGGALFLYRNANPTLVGNLIVDNHALQNASAVYCAYSHPRLVNNTIVSNPIHNEENPYIESCAVLSFLSKPVFTNNIIRDNDPDFVYLHTQLWMNKDYYTHYNNVADYGSSADNIDADPLFVDPNADDYRVAPESPGIDAGDSDAVPPTIDADLDGLLRFADRLATPDTGHGTPPIVDIGAYEYQCVGDLDGNGQINLPDLALLLAHYGTTADATYATGDLDFDGDVDLSDLAALLAVYGTTCP